MTEGTLALTAGSAHGFANALVAEVNTLNPLIKTEINNGFSSIADHTVPIRFLSDDC